MSNSAFKPVTVVLDWGTTGFRAFLVRSDGSLVDQKEGERGIQSIAKGEHGRVVSEALASWRAEYGPLDIVAAGMIGSRNGWIEMPYVPTPASAADVAAAARTEGLRKGTESLSCLA